MNYGSVRLQVETSLWICFASLKNGVLTLAHTLVGTHSFSPFAATPVRANHWLYSGSSALKSIFPPPHTHPPLPVPSRAPYRTECI